MEQLSTKAIQDLKKRFDFNEGVIQSTYSESYNKIIYFTSTDHLVYKCQHCYTPHYFKAKNEACSYCGNNHFTFNISESNEYGIFCDRCGQGFTTWTCESCKKSNSVNGTFNVLRKKGGCFIATAVYGSPIAKEVIVLKEFRDKRLLNCNIGKLFVLLYYWISPPIAAQIRNRKLLKNITKAILIKPLIRMVNKLEQSDEDKQSNNQAIDK